MASQIKKHKDLTGTDLHISKFNAGTVSPLGVVTPTVIDEAYVDRVTKDLYVSTGLTSNDWAKISSAAGINGKSAFEIASNRGFLGTESEWLQSLTGPKGNTGSQGIQGLQGIQGAKGDTGATGSVGPTGSQGVKGDIGSVGLTGAKGDKGDAGVQGPQGIQGIQGLSGSAAQTIKDLDVGLPLDGSAGYYNIDGTVIENCNIGINAGGGLALGKVIMKNVPVLVKAGSGVSIERIVSLTPQTEVIHFTGAADSTGVILRNLESVTVKGAIASGDTTYSLFRLGTRLKGRITVRSGGDSSSLSCFISADIYWDGSALACSNVVVFTTNITVSSTSPFTTNSGKLAITLNSSGSSLFSLNYDFSGHYYVTDNVNGLAPLTSPTGLTSNVATNQATLNWTAASGATSYKLKRSTVSGGPYTTVASGLTGTTYTDTGLTSGALYYYVMSYVNVLGESPNSSQVSASPLARTFVDAGVGGNHSLLLYEDGTVGSYGYNNAGQLGDGTVSGGRMTPYKIPSLTGIIQVSASPGYSMALKTDGTVYAWGENSSGQLGDNSNTDRLTPKQVPNLTGVISIASGNAQSMALKSDGTVWVWGNNGSGELGINSLVASLVPVQIPTLSGITAITCGNYHSMAIKNDGTLWTWGKGTQGQLGNGAIVDSKVPIQASISNVTKINAGTYHSIALKSDGTVYTWGENLSGQCGNGTTNNYISTPFKITSLTGCTAVQAGGYTSAALKSDGTIWAWGNNNTAQTGIGTAGNGFPEIPVEDQEVLVLVPKQTVISGAVEFYLSVNHAMAMKANGEVWAWAKNNYGQLGDGTLVFKLVPILILNRSS